MCYDNEEWCKIWKGIHLSVQNWHDEFGEFLHEHLKVSKNLHFNGVLLTKVYHVWAKKKYRRVIFDGTEDCCKIWRKTVLYFLKWHEEFAKFLFAGSKIVISF